MEYIIDAQNINKNYSGYQALNDVTIQIPKGSVYGLLGPNGAGKTTFIRLINQITKPDSGSILFNGEQLSEKHISQIGYLPEERGLYKKMKVGEQAIYFAQLKGLSKKDAEFKLRQWFEKFEILDWWNKKVEDLSKGMAQKVQFIITVLHEPQLLIFDEPFSGLDPVNTNLIKKEILELKEKGATIIFSTHNMQSVEEICDYISLLNKSEVVTTGRVNEIREKHKEYLFEVIFEGNMISFTHALWTGFELVSKEQLSKTKFKCVVKAFDNLSINVLIGAILQDSKILSVNELIPSMNDIFIKLVSEPLTEEQDEQN